MASVNPNDNRSQFFFTLDKCPELDNKNTIFGKVCFLIIHCFLFEKPCFVFQVVGDTIYNMLTLAETDTDMDERPYHPQKILKTKVLNNPFPELTPREIKRESESKKSSKSEPTVKANAVK